MTGRVPFELLPNFGGPNDIRAYPLNRWRDRVATFAQAEFRTPLVWRFGAVAFVGGGLVAPSIGALNHERVRPSAGIGLRYRLFTRERGNLRVDLAFGQGSRALYVAFAEVF